MTETKTLRLSIPVNELDHVIGPTTASVTVVTYGDYQCPDCHRRHRAIEKIVDELLHSVRFVYRHFPLINVHPQALRAAEAAEAAAAQGKFWEMHRLLYSHSPKLNDAELRRHARKIGLDMETFDRDMASDKYKDPVLSSYHNSILNGITGAPTTFINEFLCPKTDVELLDAVKASLKDQIGNSVTS